MKGAVVNYLHPFLFLKRQLGLRELWGGNMHSQAGQLERHQLLFTSAHQSPLPTLEPAPGAVKQQQQQQQKAQEKFAENCMYQTKQAFAAGLTFTLCRGCLCFLFLETGGIPSMQRGENRIFAGEGVKRREASTLILQPSFLTRKQPK